MKKFLPLTSALVIASPASGVIIAGLLDEETDIINTGGLVASAVHFQGSGSGDPDPLFVNGIPHTLGSGSDSSLTANIGFEGDFRNGGTGLPQDGSNAVQVLLSGIGGTGTLTLSVADLSPGQTYLFQTYFDRTVGETIEATIEGETLAGIDTFKNGSNQGATLISKEFVADVDGVFDASFVRDSPGGDGNAWLSGYSIQAIPEPSTSLLGVIAALGLLRRRRP